MVSESGDPAKGAVASRQAAKLYGLEILAENINYNSANHTRFIIIADQPEHRPDADKITVVIATQHEPGSLYKVLQHFYKGGLNMLNLESRPMEGRSWEYFFHIDLTGNLEIRTCGRDCRTWQNTAPTAKFWVTMWPTGRKGK